ncbi:MAG TPA: amidohydrolase family protein, partial [Terriglobales bacterium]|nr:amidohydrolase family protein [Terriglobales bacterium]
TDAHVHLLSPDQFPLYLANGVTTVINLEGRPAHLAWRKQIADGKLEGPTIFTSGPIFFGSRTVETGVKFVDQQADAGYDIFKIILLGGTPEAHEPVAAEVKKRNLLFIGHLPRAVGAEKALQSGQSVAHADEFLYTYFNPKRTEDVQQVNVHHIVADESRIPELARRVREAGVIVEPTLVTYRDGIEEATNLDSYLKKPELKYLSPWVLDNISPAKNRFKAVYTPPEYPIIRQLYPFQQKIVRALFDAGVPLLAGTDATDSGPVAGFSLHDELEELVKCGLSPYEALKAATVNPATWLRHSDQFGSIAVGKRADLVLLNANPLDKIGNTRMIAGVVIRGKWTPHTTRPFDIRMSLQAKYAQEASDFVRNLEQNPKLAAEWDAENDPFRGMSTYLLTQQLAQRGSSGFKTLLTSIREKDPDSPFTSEAAINQLGYQLLGDNKSADAIAMFELNTEMYPKSANTFDSLGEAQFKLGDTAKAVASYRRALEADSAYPNADFAKKFIAEHAK